MSAEFFSHYVGRNGLDGPLDVRADEGMIAIETPQWGIAATPEQAAKLGRALIKAAKWAQKHSTGGTAK